MEKNDIKTSRDILISAVQSMSEEQLEKFTDKANLDFRQWYRVYINGEEMRWWAHKGELPGIKERYQNVEFEPIPFAEFWTD